MARPYFSSANAKEMAAKSAAARRAKAIAVREAVIAYDIPKAHKLDPTKDYISDRLLRVRKQIDRVDRMLMTEEDPQRIDRLAAASARLAEQERQLANRPLPGSYRPTTKSKGHSGPYALPEPDDQD